MAPRVLIVGTGAGGGIGRYELLVVRALDDLEVAGRLTFSTLWRRPHPPYLRAGPHAQGRLASEAKSPAAFALQVSRAIRRARPDTVLFTHVNLARLAPALSLTRPRPRFVVVAHGIEVWTRLSRPKRAALRAADRVITPSWFTRHRLTDEQGIPAEKVLTVPLCLEPYWLDSRLDSDQRGRAAADPRTGPLTRLLTVSRLDLTERAKGVDWVIRALPVVAQTVPDVSYAIVGDGDDVSRLRSLASARGVAGRIDFKGVLDQDELISEYKACDVFVLPSAKEGFGLVFLEAMAFAKPVVARAAKAAPEVVEDGETGVLIRSRDELAGALIGLLCDRDRASRMGAAGRRRVVEEFSFQRYEARMSHLLEEVSAL